MEWQVITTSNICLVPSGLPWTIVLLLMIITATILRHTNPMASLGKVKHHYCLYLFLVFIHFHPCFPFVSLKFLKCKTPSWIYQQPVSSFEASWKIELTLSLTILFLRDFEVWDIEKCGWIKALSGDGSILLFCCLSSYQYHRSELHLVRWEFPWSWFTSLYEASLLSCFLKCSKQGH